MAPPPSRSGEVSPATGCGLPAATWTMPRTPSVRADQPMACRPAGPLLTGSRIIRQPDHTRASGHEPADLADGADHGRRARTPCSPPGSTNQTEAATTTATPDEEEPGAVATVLGVELACGVAEASGAGADRMGDRQPDRGQRSEEHE